MNISTLIRKIKDSTVFISTAIAGGVTIGWGVLLAKQYVKFDQVNPIGFLFSLFLLLFIIVVTLTGFIASVITPLIYFGEELPSGPPQEIKFIAVEMDNNKFDEDNETMEENENEEI